MYFYLYDAFLREKKYEVPLAKVEGRLFDLGLQGRAEKLTILKSMKEIVSAALKRGADTIVAVGNDETMSKLIRLVADSDVLLGFIPVGGKSLIADVLGIPEGERACDALSRRVIERVDLGKANDVTFLSFLEVTPGPDLFLECDGRYTLEPLEAPHALTMFNLGYWARSPRDGVLEAVLEPETEKRSRFSLRGDTHQQTVIPFTTMRVKSLGRSLAAYADGQTVVKTPFTVSVLPRKIRIIVGKTHPVEGT